MVLHDSLTVIPMLDLLLILQLYKTFMHAAAWQWICREMKLITKLFKIRQLCVCQGKGPSILRQVKLHMGVPKVYSIFFFFFAECECLSDGICTATLIPSSPTRSSKECGLKQSREKDKNGNAKGTCGSLQLESRRALMFNAAGKRSTSQEEEKTFERFKPFFSFSHKFA